MQRHNLRRCNAKRRHVMQVGIRLIIGIMQVSIMQGGNDPTNG